MPHVCVLPHCHLLSKGIQFDRNLRSSRLVFDLFTRIFPTCLHFFFFLICVVKRAPVSMLSCLYLSPSWFPCKRIISVQQTQLFAIDAGITSILHHFAMLIMYLFSPMQNAADCMSMQVEVHITYTSIFRFTDCISYMLIHVSYIIYIYIYCCLSEIVKLVCKSIPSFSVEVLQQTRLNPREWEQHAVYRRGRYTRWHGCVWLYAKTFFFSKHWLVYDCLCYPP